MSTANYTKEVTVNVWGRVSNLIVTVENGKVVKIVRDDGAVVAKFSPTYDFACEALGLTPEQPSDELSKQAEKRLESFLNEGY